MRVLGNYAWPFYEQQFLLNAGFKRIYSKSSAEWLTKKRVEILYWVNKTLDLSLINKNSFELLMNVQILIKKKGNLSDQNKFSSITNTNELNF